MGLEKVGGLWLKDGKDGKKFMSGEVELEGRGGPKIRLFVFKNEDKEPGSKQPDYRIMRGDDEPRPQAKQQTQAQVPVIQRDRVIDDDDLPF